MFTITKPKGLALIEIGVRTSRDAHVITVPDLKNLSDDLSQTYTTISHICRKLSSLRVAYTSDELYDMLSRVSYLPPDELKRFVVASILRYQRVYWLHRNCPDNISNELESSQSFIEACDIAQAFRWCTGSTHVASDTDLYAIRVLDIPCYPELSSTCPRVISSDGKLYAVPTAVSNQVLKLSDDNTKFGSLNTDEEDLVLEHFQRVGMIQKSQDYMSVYTVDLTDAQDDMTDNICRIVEDALMEINGCITIFELMDLLDQVNAGIVVQCPSQEHITNYVNQILKSCQRLQEKYPYDIYRYRPGTELLKRCLFPLVLEKYSDLIPLSRFEK